MYFILNYKLQKIKEYLKENLKKKFIILSKASFASSILFVEKKDDSLCFCMNYWKLNALIKKDRYSILLIDEVLAWIQDSKYLTQLNIICYDSSYASMLITMLMTMSMTMFMTIVDRSSLDYWIVSKSTLFRISLCFSESYK